MPIKKAHLIANPKSGKGKGATIIEEAQKLCDELGIELITYPVDKPNIIDELSAKAVKNAEANRELVMAAGGDGTIRAVAQAAHGKNVIFGAIACGTFNFFARTHKLPEDPIEALRLALTGQSKPVRLGIVNGHVFLINASLGLYAKAIHEREMRTNKWGRNRFVVIISTIMSFLSDHFLLKVELQNAGHLMGSKTPMIFIGNNALQLRDLKMDVASCMKGDMLAVVMMKPITKFEAVRIILRGIFSTIEKDERLDMFCVKDLAINTHKKSNLVALDGEMFTMQSPYKVEAMPEALHLVVPT